jgi:hypothetical protein
MKDQIGFVQNVDLPARQSPNAFYAPVFGSLWTASQSDDREP